MSRLQVLKQRCAREGLSFYRIDSGRYDIIDQVGPRDLNLSKRTAINLAASWAAKKAKTRMYVMCQDGSWHRWNCERIAAPFVDKKNCKCQYLVV